jgi:hypothetical protein
MAKSEQKESVVALCFLVLNTFMVIGHMALMEVRYRARKEREDRPFLRPTLDPGWDRFEDLAGLSVDEMIKRSEKRHDG